jgi:transposase-like protein
MSSQCYSPEFKDEAVRQIVERGYSVAEASERLGVSSHSLYKWVKAVKPGKTEQHEADLVEASRVYSVCPKTSGSLTQLLDRLAAGCVMALIHCCQQATATACNT